MAIDLEHLREHYASLSDEAFGEIEPADLVEAARTCYEEERARRKAAVPGKNAAPLRENSANDHPSDDEAPDWLAEGVEVLSWYAGRHDRSNEIADAKASLRQAGIPCHLEFKELEPDMRSAEEPTNRWVLLVPSKLNLWAGNVLERDLNNAGFESLWRTHLESLSEEELLAQDPETVFCALFDRIDRATRAYNDELVRRGLADGGE